LISGTLTLLFEQTTQHSPRIDLAAGYRSVAETGAGVLWVE